MRPVVNQVSSTVLNWPSLMQPLLVPDGLGRVVWSLLLGVGLILEAVGVVKIVVPPRTANLGLKPRAS